MLLLMHGRHCLDMAVVILPFHNLPPHRPPRILPPSHPSHTHTHACTYLTPHPPPAQALREAILDEAEGADIMMVKPGLPYLDVIRLLRDSSSLPIAAYHVSGAVRGRGGGRCGGRGRIMGNEGV